MPFNKNSQRAHTQSIDAVFTPPRYDKPPDGWMLCARWSRNAQLLLWLGLGTELGYFDISLAAGILKRVAEETRGYDPYNSQEVKWREMMPALALDRYYQLLRDGLGTPTYRVPLEPS